MASVEKKAGHAEVILVKHWNSKIKATPNKKTFNSLPQSSTSRFKVVQTGKEKKIKALKVRPGWVRALAMSCSLNSDTPLIKNLALLAQCGSSIWMSGLNNSDLEIKLITNMRAEKRMNLGI
jgi:hypothetical protein